MPTERMPTKESVRAAALAARRALDTRRRLLADRAITAAAVELARGAAVVAGHAPMVTEPGGVDLPDALAAHVRTLLLPVLLADLDLDWATYAPGVPLHAGGGRRMREPVGPRLGVDAIRQADLVFVPALAVDRTGVRLGRGGGSYDRALARVAPTTPVIALLYDDEVHDTLPVEPHDQRVSGVITPSGLWWVDPARSEWTAQREVRHHWHS